MPGVISSIRRNMFASDSSADLQTAQQKADAVIRKLRGNGDTDVTAILVARYEALEERQEQLMQYQASLSKDQLEEPAGHTAPEDNHTSSFLQCKIVTQDDRIQDCIPVLPGLDSDDPAGVSLEFVTRPPPNSESHQVENIMAAAEHLITTAMETIEEHLQTLQYFRIKYLSDMSDRLSADEQKIESLKTRASSTATELAAHFYFSDALRFLRTVLLMAGYSVDDEEIQGGD